MDVVTLGILAYLLGVILNVLYPYLSAYLEKGDSFDYRYAISRVLAALVVGGVAIVAPGFIDYLVQTAGAYDYTSLYFLAVFLTTFGAGSVGRETQKLASAAYKAIV